MVERKLKNNETITLKLENHKFSDILMLYAYNQNNEELGFAQFSFSGNKAWLYNIRVEKEDYLQLGVGYALITTLEQYLINRRIRFVEGKYYPDGAGAEYAKGFYGRNGYEIYKENYQWFIFKSLDFTKNCAPEISVEL